MMYLDHFGLYTPPFALVPQLRFVYLSTAFEETMAHLIYGLEGGEDIILITGEVGSGKTLALRSLVSNLQGHYRFAVLSMTQVGFDDILKLILAELDIKVAAGVDRADLLILLEEQLERIRKAKERFLLVIDEAQNLDVLTLEALRMLTNLGPTEEQRIQLVLAGQPNLRTTIDRSELLQLRQRIRVHYHLDSLSPQETREYVVHRLKMAGCERDVFGDDALGKIHSLSRGVPRLVNVLADKGMLAAYVRGATKVNAVDIPEIEAAFTPGEVLESVELASRASGRIGSLNHAAEKSGGQAESEGLPPQGGRSLPVLRILGIGAAVLLVMGLLWWLFLRGPTQAASGQPMSDAGGRPERSMSPDAMPEEEQLDSVLDHVAEAEGVHAVALEPDSSDPSGAPTEDRDEGRTEASAPAESMIPEPGDPAVVANNLSGPCIQVASFRDLRRAVVLRDQLAGISDRCTITSVVLKGVTWFRVYSGPWDTMSEAREMELIVRDSGLVDWTLLVSLP